MNEKKTVLKEIYVGLFRNKETGEYEADVTGEDNSHCVYNASKYDKLEEKTFEVHEEKPKTLSDKLFDKYTMGYGGFYFQDVKEHLQKLKTRIEEKEFLNQGKVVIDSEVLGDIIIEIFGEPLLAEKGGN